MGLRSTPLRLTTVRSRELGEELRRARIRTEARAEHASRSLGWSPSKLSRLEHGERGVDDLDLGSLLGQLNVDKATRERVRFLAGERDPGNFLRSHDGKLSDNLLSLIIHERAALTMHKYEPMVIPSLLQTRAYAEAMIKLHGVEDPVEPAPLVEARMSRASPSRRLRWMRNNQGRCSPTGRISTTSERTAMAKALTWRKSSYSGGGQTDCVEVAHTEPGVAVRDSKNATGPTLAFPESTWRAFLTWQD
ncbi:Scr1 family TA system antitoxin-like transcriptional regulator [Saccharothrix isguenensis]